MTVVKFWISSYFAQITSIVSCFRKYPSKVLKRFSFFEIEESSKIAILAASPRRKWPKIVQINAMIFINILWAVHSACLAVSKALI